MQKFRMAEPGANVSGDNLLSYRQIQVITKRKSVTPLFLAGLAALPLSVFCMFVLIPRRPRIRLFLSLLIPVRRPSLLIDAYQAAFF